MKTWEKAGLYVVLIAALAAAADARADRDVVVIYPSYSDARSVAIEGRVLEERVDGAAQTDDRWWSNLWRNLRRLVSDERANRSVVVRLGDGDRATTTDAEGYFRIAAAVAELAPGWHEVSAQAGPVSGAGALLVVPAGNTLGIISDLDDTILVSEVTDKSRLLANTLLKNPLQRQAVPGVAALYRRLLAGNPQPEAAPMIYLSASPRQLAGNIQGFLDANAFPRGVLITKKVTNDATSEPLADQMAYKTAKLDELMTRLPWVRWVLVGDDGEKDPEIYRDVRARHAERVRAVWVRRVHPDPNRARYAGQGDLAAALAARP